MKQNNLKKYAALLPITQRLPSDAGKGGAPGSAVPTRNE